MFCGGWYEARDKGCQCGGSERMTGSSRALRERLIDNCSSLTEARNERWSEEQMGTSNPNRSGRPSTEVVVCNEPMCLELRHCVEPRRKDPYWSRRGVVQLSTPTAMHPGNCPSLSHTQHTNSGTPTRLQAAGVMSRAVEIARLRWCCVCCVCMARRYGYRTLSWR